MLDPVHEECGIAAVYLMRAGCDGIAPDDTFTEAGSVSALMPRMLMDLQNRGQLAAGLTVYNPRRDQILSTYKGIGPVGEVFRMNHPDRYKALLERYSGQAAIGHVRYATCGQDDVNYAQPFERIHGRKWKWYAFCFNGNIANYAECREKILGRGDYHLVRDNDTEILSEGVTLYVAPPSQALLRGVVLDFVEIEPGDFRFILAAPEQQAAGGCGSGGCGSGGCGSGGCA